MLPPGSTCYVDLTGFLHRLANMPGPRGLDPRKIVSQITGEPTWGLVGVFHQLHTLATQRPARVIALADSSQDGFRVQLVPTYKRKTGNPYLRQQLYRLAQCLPHLGIAVLGARDEFPGMEAEDLIAKAVQPSHQPAVVISYDKDLLQLVRPGVHHYNPQKRQLVTAENIDTHLKQAFLPTRATLTGADLAVMLACVGDESDGIKPIGGIGPVTLGKYYEKLPEGLTNPAKLDALAAIDQLEQTELRRSAGKQADWAQAHLNLQATDLDTDRQRTIELGPISEPRPDKEAFRRVLEELTMPSFLKNYDQWFAAFQTLNPPELGIS